MRIRREASAPDQIGKNLKSESIPIWASVRCWTSSSKLRTTPSRRIIYLANGRFSGLNRYRKPMKKTAKKKAAKKKAAKRIDAIPQSYEEAVWGWQGDPYLADLALRLVECFSSDEGTASHTRGMEIFREEVFALLTEDLCYQTFCGNIRQLGEAIQVVQFGLAPEPKIPEIGSCIGHPARSKFRKCYAEAFLIGRELEKGERDHPPTVKEFQDILEDAGCSEPEYPNALRIIKLGGWTPSPDKLGRKPSKKT